jgi:hypothetical protein
MKLTKIASLVMTSATVLSTVAAVTPAITQAKTQEGNVAMNGGKALPDTNHSTVGITFGTNNPNPNPNPDNPNKPDDGKGYLRLQHVPAVLDFGSHTKFDSAYPIFTAAGTNLNNTSNDTNKGYAGADNQTPKLSTVDTRLAAVKGKTWVTVVDKQDSRTDIDTKNNNVVGNWQLSVKADGPLTTGKDAGAKTISGATVTFSNTVYAQLPDRINNLTGNDSDINYNHKGANFNATTMKSFQIDLGNTSSQTVGSASDYVGAGANVFAWDPSDIQLTLPTNADIEDGTYTTSLTWTLSTGIQ